MFADKKWLNARDDRFPNFENNHDRMLHTFLERNRKIQIPLKTMYGQSFAISRHYVDPNRLAFLGKMIPDCTAIGGKKDIMIDSSCTLHLAQHMGCKAVIFEEKGHIILQEAEMETIREIEQTIQAGEDRWSL